MKHKIEILIKSVGLLFFFACSEAPKQDNNSTVMEPMENVGDINTDLDTFNQTEYSIASKNDRSVGSVQVEPDHQVGLITSDMSEEDIKKLYGASKVVRVDRGDVKTVVFPNTNKELEISWKAGQEYKKLETAIIRKGDWKSTEGIGIGTTVDELSRINGKPVELFQREENYAMVRWNNGKVNSKMKVIVDTDSRKVIEMQIDF